MNANLDSYRAIYSDATRLGCRAVFGEPLRGHSTWGIGGDADLFLEPDSAAQASHLLRLVSAAGLPLVVIGCGSNLLICDEQVHGVVMKIGSRFSRISCQGTRMVADAGAWVPLLAHRSRKHGLTGLEHVIGIPGTIGGLVVMNGGSLRESIGSRVHRVHALSLAGDELVFEPGECGFAYRRSIFQDGACLITSVELDLEQGEPRAVRREMLRILRDRRSKFPLKMPSCGSVFRSEPDRFGTVGPPGKLIEEAGNKGVRVGGAQVSPQHANFIVNCGGATASDVIRLVKHMHDTVLSKSAVSLACEVRYLNSQCGFSSLL